MTQRSMEDIMFALKEEQSKTELLLLKQELKAISKGIEERTKELNGREAQLAENEQKSAKYIEYCSQNYNAFFNTRLEKDKSILTLSVAGLGFLISITNLSSKLAHWEFVIFILAAICYLVSIYLTVEIFGSNGEYLIDNVMNHSTTDEKERALDKMDKIAKYSFYSGILISFILGSSISYTKNFEGKNMADKKANTTLTNNSFAGVSLFKDSFSGATKMKPVQAAQPTTQNKQSENSNKAGETKNG
jgi:hypothetical protein